MLVHLTCPVCGTAFSRLQSQMKARSYCSKACGYAGIRQDNLAPIAIEGDIARIPLRDRTGTVIDYAVIDAADVDLVSAWPWHLNSDGYVARSSWKGGKWTDFRLHRVILGLERGNPLEGDHIDHDRRNNRRSNLRIIPKPAQADNRISRPGSSSKYRGVSWHKTKRKWGAHVRVDRKLLHLGYFASEEEAGEVAREARLRLLPYAVD